MKSKSIKWLISSISVFVLGCTIFYYVQYFKGKDPRYNYSVEVSPKKAKKIIQNSALLTQSSQEGTCVKIMEKIAPAKNADTLTAKAKSTKKKASLAKTTEPQEEFNPEWLVINNPIDKDIQIDDIEDNSNQEYITENQQPTKSQEETAKLITMVEEYQNNYFGVQSKNNEQTALTGTANGNSNTLTKDQMVAMIDNYSGAESNIKGPMRATGTGTSTNEDPFNTGVGNDNTNTYNDNNVMGSLPIGDGNMFLYILIAITACAKFIRNKTSINL